MEGIILWSITFGFMGVWAILGVVLWALEEENRWQRFMLQKQADEFLAKLRKRYR